MDEAERIWNRALDYGAALSEPGDRALRAALTFDGTASNGGLLNAVESFSEDPELSLAQIIEAFRFLGLEGTALLVSSCAQRRRITDDAGLEALELEFDPHYPMPGEDLSQALEAKLRAVPEAFRPTP